MAGYSLHIGLNHVDPTAYGGWDGALQGCLSDAASMETLALAAGYSTSSLLECDATSARVISALGDLARRASGGDICLVTYSGHGGQIDDVEGDEDEGKDETWVLFDRQLIDDELYRAWSQFASGVRLLVLSDSCHSGSVNRDLADTRVDRAMPSLICAQDNAARRATYELVKAQARRNQDADVVASVLLISGCQDDQVSFDGARNGAFTESLLEVWADGGFAGDYRAFHQAIVANMSTDQTPGLDDVLVKDAAFLTQQPFTI